MIELFSGTPGSGKSVHAASQIRERLQAKKCVIIGNFMINTKTIKKCKGVYIYVDNSRLTPQRLMQFSIRYAAHLHRSLREGELQLYIDEAQILFNSRDWNVAGRQGWLSFFSQHRKFCYDVFLIAQFDRMLDRQVRYVLENETIHRKIANAGRFGKILGFFSHGSLFYCIRRWYPVKENISTNFFLGNKNLYRLYDSYAHFEA